MSGKMVEWISTKDKLPENDELVLVLVNGKFGNLTFVDAYELATYSTDEGWIIESSPEFEGPSVSWWMPLPELPMEKDDAAGSTHARTPRR